MTMKVPAVRRRIPRAHDHAYEVVSSEGRRRMRAWSCCRLALGGVLLAVMLASCSERVPANVQATATPIETQAPEEGVKAISDLEAYVFTTDSVLHTTDGGTSWSDVSPPSH